MALTVKDRVRALTRGEPMSDMKEHIMMSFMRDGIGGIAEAIGMSSKTAHQKMKGEEGFKIDQLAAVFESMGYRLIDTTNQVAVDIDEYQSLVKNSRKYLETIEKSIEQKEKRRPDHLKPVS